jgi:hypothetical protein
MPPAKRAAAKPKSTAKKTSGSGATKTTSGSTRRTSGDGTTSRSTRATGARSSAGPTASAQAAASTATAGLEAVADRVRKLNERIIEAGKTTGETTLSSYERALEAIVSAVERGPGSSDIDWIAHLATAQANFIRDFTETWTTTARNILKK